MEQELIQRLWKHTDQVNEENARWMESSNMQGFLEKNRRKSADLLSSQYYFRDNKISLFMSFHHEISNLHRHCHDFFELIYVCKGTPIGVINDQEIELQHGTLCIMNPNAEHYFKKYSEQTDLILNIVLPKALFRKAIFQILFNDPVLNGFFIRYRLENEDQPSFLFLQHLDQDIDTLIEILLKEYLDKKQYSQVVIESLLTLLFSFILRKYNEKNSHGNQAIAEIIDYIYMNYQTITMESVAAHFNYHPKYLSSLLHKRNGQTFRNMVVSIKLQNAVNYLMYTDYSIEHIVELIGYKDKSGFYSLFKKEYRMSPAEYRRQHSLNAAE